MGGKIENYQNTIAIYLWHSNFSQTWFLTNLAGILYCSIRFFTIDGTKDVSQNSHRAGGHVVHHRFTGSTGLVQQRRCDINEVNLKYKMSDQILSMKIEGTIWTNHRIHNCFTWCESELEIGLHEFSNGGYLLQFSVVSHNPVKNLGVVHRNFS